MSSPLWMWSPRSSPYGLVTVPLETGPTIRPSDVQPPLPVETGVEETGGEEPGGEEPGADDGGAGAGSAPGDGREGAISPRPSTGPESAGPPVASEDGDDDDEGVPAEAITV